MFSEIDKIAQPSGIKSMITVCPLIGTVVFCDLFIMIATV